MNGAFKFNESQWLICIYLLVLAEYFSLGLSTGRPTRGHPTG